MSKGYLLPDGDAYEEDTECILVFVPARDEYRRALRGTLDYLGTWLAWERDTLKRGRDAARAWKAANDMTWECYDMNACETIIQLLTDIRNNQDACCNPAGGQYVQYGPNVVVTTTVVPGQGSYPETWGEQSLSSWSDWEEYVCGAAHDYVDDLVETIGKLKLGATVLGYPLDFIAHLFSLVQWRMVEDIIPVDFSVIGAIVNALGEGLLGVDFDQVASDVEGSRSDIVCSLMQGTSLEDAVEAAINNTALWNVFFQWFDYETTTAAIYHGEVEGHGYLTPIQRTDCECDTQADCYALFDFDNSLQGWDEISSEGVPYVQAGGPVAVALISHPGEGRLQVSPGDINAQGGCGIGGVQRLVRLKFDYKFFAGASWSMDAGDYIQCRYYTGSGTWLNLMSKQFGQPGTTENTWFTWDTDTEGVPAWLLANNLLNDGTGHCLEFRFYQNNHHGGNGFVTGWAMHIRNVEFWVDAS